MSTRTAAADPAPSGRHRPQPPRRSQPSRPRPSALPVSPCHPRCSTASRVPCRRSRATRSRRSSRRCPATPAHATTSSATSRPPSRSRWAPSCPSRPAPTTRAPRSGPAREASYNLGRGEARSGRSMDALLSAYRIGARVSWRGLSEESVRAGMSAELLARFAELVFAYIDELSAASVAGHADELATAERVQQRQLERLALEMLRGASDELGLAPGRAGRLGPPAVGDRAPRARLGAAPHPDARRRQVARPDRGRARRRRPRRRGSADRAPADADRPTPAHAGPRRPRRGPGADPALAAKRPPPTSAPCGGERRAPSRDTAYDTDAHLAEIVLSADPIALADLRAQALAPLDDSTPASRRAPRGDAAAVAAAPRPARARRRGVVRPPADRALPRRPAA